MKLTITIFLCGILNISLAQNLVMNSSFENYKSCPQIIGQFNYSVESWSTPNFASTDYFNTCSEAVGSVNYNGVQAPRTGNAYAGIYVYSDKNYREYVQGKLSETLEKGQKYKVTFYISLADESSLYTKDIMFLFSEEKLKVSFNSNKIESTVIPKKLTNKGFKLFSDLNNRWYSDTNNWMKFSFEFTSQGYENYFSIGNFHKNSKTKKEKLVSQSPYSFSYYYIDDVSVEPIEKENIKVNLEVSDTSEIKKDTLYTFQNILFDFDQFELLENSTEELNELYKHLSANSNLTIEIYGHTDNIGLDSRNTELSEQRAKAVADYLISQGLMLHRVKWFGYGSSKPIATNETEAGRELNRRVDFKLIEK